MRTSLQGLPSIDPADVDQEVLEHIEQELGGRKEPIPSADMQRVLERLGRPSQWVSDDELPWWRRVVLQLRRGPEDWRLAYLAFGLFLMSVLWPPYSWFWTILWPGVPVGPSAVLLFGSLLACRAALSASQEREERLGAQRWLVYPPLFCAYLLLTVIPVISFIYLAADFGDKIFWPAVGLNVPYGLTVAAAAGALGFGVSAVSWKWPDLTRAVFFPFAQRFARSGAKYLACFWLTLLVLSSGVGLLIGLQGR